MWWVLFVLHLQSRETCQDSVDGICPYLLTRPRMETSAWFLQEQAGSQAPTRPWQRHQQATFETGILGMLVTAEQGDAFGDSQAVTRCL